METLQMDQWERKEIYEFMSKLSHPFYTVCFQADVTPVYAYTHKKGLSFYYAMVYLMTQAINEVPAFLKDIAENEVVILDRRSPSFTDLRKGSESFYIVSMLAGQDLDGFCKEARRISMAQDSFFSKEKPEGEAWIYFSCLPWLETTCVTNERDFDPNDTVPRISWGKYVTHHGRKRMNVSVEVNHRFIDGCHIGQFESRLREKIAMLEET